MKYLKSYKLFESNVNSIIDSYLSDIKWDIQNSLGNCAFFAKDFYEWCQSKGIKCQLIYLKQDEDFIVGDEIEDHIAPMIDEQLIDFVYTPMGVSRRVRQNSTNAIERQLNPEITQKNNIINKYGQWGYNTIQEVSYEEAYQGNNPKCTTIDYPNRLNETIKIPIKVGDTVLGGRFKNKKMVVKKIGKNKKGDITINDKPLLKFRLVKESFQEDVDDHFSHLKDDGFVIEQGEDYVRIFRPKYGDFYAATNLQEFNFSEIAGDIHRFVDYVGDEFHGDEFTTLPYSISNIVYLTNNLTSVVGDPLLRQLDRKTISIDKISDLDLDFKLSALAVYVK